MAPPLRVLLLEDREGDAALVSSLLDRARVPADVRWVDSREEFVRILETAPPDIVLSDHSTAGFSSLAALDAVRAICPGVPVIVVTGHPDERLVVECIRAGAEDVVGKNSLSRLPSAIAGAMAVRERLSRLSPRQRLVLRLVAEGQSTPAIAERLDLSAKTVETHRGELMRRMGIHDVVGLVRFAVRVGIVKAEAGPS